MKKLMIIGIAIMLVVFASLQARAAWAEDRPLHADDGTCLNESSVLGSTDIVDRSDDKVQVMVKISDPAAASQTFQVFWVCTTVQNGCHSNACGFVNIGKFTTGASGRGSFNTILANGNPFPGHFVHVDICPGTTGGCSGPVHDSTFESIFQDTPTLQALAPSGFGDPTD